MTAQIVKQDRSLTFLFSPLAKVPFNALEDIDALLQILLILLFKLRVLLLRRHGHLSDECLCRCLNAVLALGVIRHLNRIDGAYRCLGRLSRILQEAMACILARAQGDAWLLLKGFNRTISHESTVSPSHTVFGFN